MTIDEADHQAERYTRRLLQIEPDQAEGFQLAAAHLLAVARGETKDRTVLLLVDGEPPKDIVPAKAS